MANHLIFSVEPTSYQGEPWFLAKAGIVGIPMVVGGYGRTGGRALAFALQDLSNQLLAGTIGIEVEPLPPGMTSEAVDFRAEEVP